MEGFLVHTLKAIRQESGRKHKELRESCAAALTKLDSSLMPQKQSEAPADQYFQPLQLACQTRNPRITCTALDCIQKLIAYGYLRGRGTATDELADESRPNLKLMDLVIETMCACKDHSDETVQLQLLKALLTAVSSSHSEVHDTSLLNAVRACYHIHLVSKNVVNKTTAKATLSQILNVVFQHMERFDGKEGQDSDSEPLPPPSTPPPSALTPTHEKGQKNEEQQEKVEPAGGDVNEGNEKESTENGQDEGESSVSELNKSSVFSQNMYDSVYSNLGFIETSETSTVKHVSSVAGTETNALSSVSESETNLRGKFKARPSLAQFEFKSLWHKDAFLLFRALCKLSMKHEDVVKDDMIEHTNTVSDPIALRSKVLALDLLLSVLENSGPSFQSSDMFVFAIKSYLVSSLIKNCVSSNTSVVGLSLRIFVTLQEYFKDELKEEIELFISKIFSKILESPNSPRDHKILVLEVFMRICKDVNTLVELFLNYDCNWDSQDLFAKTVQVLTRLATKSDSDAGGTANSANPGSPAQGASNQASALSVMALDSIVAILKSLSEYTHLEDQLPITVDVGMTNPELVEKPSSKSLKEFDIQNGDENETESQVMTVSIGGDQATNVNRASAAVDSYQQKRKFKNDMRVAVSKFNFKPKAGIQYMVEKGLVEDTPQKIAIALYEHRDLLSKTQIGEYIGEEKPKNVEIMTLYVEQFDFHGLSFVDALRRFMDAFRLPGEAQKIDRIIEKFAGQYRLHNPGEFDDGDSAFLLAFAIIMLNTDAHNPNIKPEKKMKLPSFLNMTSVCNKDEAFISAIYHDIVSRAITLKEDDALRAREKEKQSGSGGMFGNEATLERQKREAYVKERSVLVSEAQRVLPGATKGFFGPAGRRAQGETGLYFTDAHDVLLSNEHVRPMFEVVWGPMLAIFSVNMQSASDPLLVSMSIRGMHLAVRIAARFNLSGELETLIGSLSQVAKVEDAKPLEAKNLECITALLLIGEEEGDYLGESWVPVLLCASQVAEMLALSAAKGDDVMMVDGGVKQTGGSSQRMIRRGSSAGAATPTGTSGFNFFSSSTAAAVVSHRRLNSARMVETIDGEMVERLFLKSVKLSTTAIVEFVSALCQVSLFELNLSSKVQQVAANAPDRSPRIFSLQRLVEVADFNMGIRPRFVWERVWSVLSKHFAAAGLHSKVPVSLYAIDSLRQLSSKFLEKDELSGFSFQVRFLKPFQVIMSESHSVEQRELVMSCIQNMVSSKSYNIKSGWHSILKIVEVGTKDDSHSVVVLALQVLNSVITKHLGQVESIRDVFKCCLSCASNQTFEHEALAGLDHLQECSKRILGSESDQPFPSQSDAMETMWWMVFVKLASLVGDIRFEVRTRAYEVLLSILQEHHVRFKPVFLRELTEDVLSRVTSNVLYPDEQQGNSLEGSSAAQQNGVMASPPAIPDASPVLSPERSTSVITVVSAPELDLEVIPAPIAFVLDDREWASTTFSKYSSQFIATLAVWFNDQGSPENPECDVWYAEMRDIFEGSMLKFILDHLKPYVLSDLDIVSRSSVWVLHDLLDMCGEKLSEKLWSQVMDFIEIIIYESVPKELISDFTRRWVHVDQHGRQPQPLTDDETASEYSQDSGLPTEASSAELENSPTLAVRTLLSKGETRSVYSGSPTRLQRMGSWEPEEAPVPPPNPNDPLPFDAPRVLNLCVVQLQLIRILGEVVARHLSSMKESDCERCLEILDSKASFAHVFNSDFELRACLHTRGFMKQQESPAKSPRRPSPPNLLRQETLAVASYLDILIRIQDGSDRYSEVFSQQCESRLRMGWINVVRLFVDQDTVLEESRGITQNSKKDEGQMTKATTKSQQDARGEASQFLNYFTGVLVQVMEKLGTSKNLQKKECLAWLLPSLTSLMVCQSRKVRLAVKELLNVLLPQAVGIEFENISDEIIVSS